MAKVELCPEEDTTKSLEEVSSRRWTGLGSLAEVWDREVIGGVAQGGTQALEDGGVEKRHSKELREGWQLLPRNLDKPGH